jgi:hypothetical protein
MGYRAMGRAHASLARMRAKLRESAGQGTVEYVALMLLVAGLLTAVIGIASGTDVSSIPSTLVKRLKDAIDRVGQPPAK